VWSARAKRKNARDRRKRAVFPFQKGHSGKDRTKGKALEQTKAMSSGEYTELRISSELTGPVKESKGSIQD